MNDRRAGLLEVEAAMERALERRGISTEQSREMILDVLDCLSDTQAARNARYKKSGVVMGALIECIRAHGPITETNVVSAAKRITGQIAGLDTEGYWRKRYDRLHHAYRKMITPDRIDA